MSIEQLFVNTSLSQRITQNEWEQLVTIANSPLTPEEQLMVKRIVHSVRRGWFSILGQEGSALDANSNSLATASPA
ncbi:hypothetical protein [[Phormidium] sp. ETS-05]|uniref:hypothetical protein n=1 Tax=[Phormidium] sp. ETS-05 TaxID=222819 RepID=UPI0018EF1BA8|nr:hypothetical protein [[Phormidium] sp. ETS-05]